MWERKILRLSGATGGIVCSVMEITPWTPGAGQKTLSGVYLSPENAVTTAARRLAGLSPRLDITALMFSAPTLTSFTEVLAQAAVVFPLASLMQTHRRALSALTLAQTRMQIPSPPNGLPAMAPLSVPSLRQASAAVAMSSGSAGGGDIADAMASFRAQRSNMIAAATATLDSLTGRTLPVRAVSVAGDVPGAVREMREGVPHPDHVFSLCLVFIGEDLTALRGMLNDERKD